ncbi:MAG: MFS transporter [Candidatus Eisenbacteria bacterium]
MPAPLSRATPARILLLLCIAEPLGMSPWFAASAVAPQLAARWSLDAGGTAALTSMVQLGFVAGTALIAVLNLADVVAARALFAGCALLAAFANASLLLAPGFGTALAARFALGVCLAGVYPPAMKMVATWFKERRGLAIGTLVGALAIGKAGPYLVRALGGATLESVVAITSVSALLAALLVAVFYREGPFPFPRRAFHWGLVGEVARHRETRIAVGGYLGHMWELYAMWTWLPAFLAASLAVSAPPGLAAAERASAAAGWFAFGALAAGGLGCVWGGWAAARLGYARVVTISMAASAACALLIGFLFGAPPWLIATVAWIWGFFVVADSAQFSSMVTEVAPPHAVGTALTLQTSLGFLLTMATIQLVPVLAETAGWRWAFPILALGPLAGITVIAKWPKRAATHPSRRNSSRNASP